MNQASSSVDEKENLPLGVQSTNFVPPPTPLLKKIGFGTGVSVYHLDRSPCNHTVRSPWALKTVNRQHASTHFQERIESEAKILKELKHPNIVGFRGFSKTSDGRKVLAMEECSESLGELIENMVDNGGVRFTPEQILMVIASVAKALQYLHEEKGLLHGDLKSFNVLIKGDFEEVKLCDFGVTLDLKTAKVEDYVGTGAWSAPETLEEGPLTDKADIFSLGLIIWEMLTLSVPHINTYSSMSFSESFDDETSCVELEQHYGETPELPAELGPELGVVTELYSWCTRQDWRLRPSARDLLNHLASAGFTAVHPPTPVEITL